MTFNKTSLTSKPFRYKIPVVICPRASNPRDFHFVKKLLLFPRHDDLQLKGKISVKTSRSDARTKTLKTKPTDSVLRL